MATNKTPQTMKPETAAKKLGVYLPATPEEFRSNPVTREQLNELLSSPPEWLVELRKNGPHPRSEVARKLGVSVSGLARAEMNDAALTTAEITALLEAPPQWLVTERATQAEVRAENTRINERKAGQRILDEEKARTQK
ncbi:hypothetical protein L1277_002624 [Okibacterium sp. HSC-33S16]|uniref:DUF5997 family protein n=1 Tax=Okibacterium sp. HSC-33S16 TaxID=2910965 RepID=UPI0020A06496|nr:DUF5997 family protein [Okibacterium sp. HSC-33S16]MCP2032521.1 hypothetical protein [Okibacterium sp. HSC-33S16]